MRSNDGPQQFLKSLKECGFESNVAPRALDPIFSSSSRLRSFLSSTLPTLLRPESSLCCTFDAGQKAAILKLEKDGGILDGEEARKLLCSVQDTLEKENPIKLAAEVASEENKIRIVQKSLEGLCRRRDILAGRRRDIPALPAETGDVWEASVESFGSCKSAFEKLESALKSSSLRIQSVSDTLKSGAVLSRVESADGEFWEALKRMIDRVFGQKASSSLEAASSSAETDMKRLIDAYPKSVVQLRESRIARRQAGEWEGIHRIVQSQMEEWSSLSPSQLSALATAKLEECKLWESRVLEQRLTCDELTRRLATMLTGKILEFDKKQKVERLSRYCAQQKKVFEGESPKITLLDVPESQKQFEQLTTLLREIEEDIERTLAQESELMEEIESLKCSPSALYNNDRCRQLREERTTVDPEDEFAQEILSALDLGRSGGLLTWREVEAALVELRERYTAALPKLSAAKLKIERTVQGLQSRIASLRRQSAPGRDGVPVLVDPLLQRASERCGAAVRAAANTVRELRQKYADRDEGWRRFQKQVFVDFLTDQDRLARVEEELKERLSARELAIPTVNIDTARSPTPSFSLTALSSPVAAPPAVETPSLLELLLDDEDVE